MITLLSVYLGATLLLALFQRSLLYYPTRAPEDAMIREAAAWNLEPWRDAQGTLIGWRRMAAHSTARLLVFHGNAGHAAHRDPYASVFSRLSAPGPWDVHILEYPGYGSRPGAPSRKAFAEAAAHAAHQLVALDGRPLFLLGESIGSGVACELAAAPGIDAAGIILVTPFHRLADVAQEKFPIFPTGWVLLDRWDNAAALANFRGPLALILAGKDEVIGVRQGERLFEEFRGPKRRWLFPEATHNDPRLHSIAPWAGEVAAWMIEASQTPRLPADG